jgi:hypothetical protein
MRKLACLVLLCCLPWLAEAAAPEYRVDYRIGFDPDAGEAVFAMTVTPKTGRLQRLRFSIDPERHHTLKADGRLTHKDDRYTWRPPEEGAATLRFRYKVDRRRDGDSYDARITDDWALLRADRLFPPASTIGPDDAVADARLVFDLPQGWTNQEVGYPYSDSLKRYVIRNQGKRFQQPLGWMIAGQVGTRRDFIDGMEVVVAAPKGDPLRRNDVLAMLNTSAAEAREAFGRLPEKLLIVGAGDPMWRGGLSGPSSLYLHSDRPMISENGTSALLHEIVHVVTRIRGARGQDWIAEGFAEYYSIRLLERAGLISGPRADKAFEWMREHGKSVTRLSATASSGKRTARAVTLLHELDAEIRKATKDAKDLDVVTRELTGRGRISLAELQEAVDGVLGRESKVLRSGVLSL